MNLKSHLGLPLLFAVSGLLACGPLEELDSDYIIDNTTAPTASATEAEPCEVDASCGVISAEQLRAASLNKDVGFYKETPAGTVPEIEFVVAETSVAESAGNTALVIWLSSLTNEAVVVDYFVTGSATGSGIDYELANGRVAIPAGELATDIPLRLVDDTEVEGTETLTAILARPSGATLGTNIFQTVTIRDNDVVSSSGAISPAPAVPAPTPSAGVAGAGFDFGGGGCSLVPQR